MKNLIESNKSLLDEIGDLDEFLMNSDSLKIRNEWSDIVEKLFELDQDPFDNEEIEMV